jgi:hypothetical protein
MFLCLSSNLTTNSIILFVNYSCVIIVTAADTETRLKYYTEGAQGRSPSLKLEGRHMIFAALKCTQRCIKAIMINKYIPTLIENI